MSHRFSMYGRAIRACIACALLFIAAEHVAFAQGAACAGAILTVNNLSGCQVNFCVVDVGNGNGNVNCIALPVGGVGAVPVTPGARVVGIQNWCCFYPFQPNIAPPPNWWVPNVMLGPGCCCDVLFDEATCTINVVPTAVVGPPCRP